MGLKSKALKANIESYSVDVTIAQQYLVLKEIMSGYYGLEKRHDRFLKELSHPYKNWDFILSEVTHFSLGYFGVFRLHEKGPAGVRLYFDIFLSCVHEARGKKLKYESSYQLMRYVGKILSGAGDMLPRFLPELASLFGQLADFPAWGFEYFLKGHYPVTGIGHSLLKQSCVDDKYLSPASRFIMRFLEESYGKWLSHDDPALWFKSGAEEFCDELTTMFGAVTHKRLHELSETVNKLSCDEKDRRSCLETLSKMPGHGFIVKRYSEIPSAIMDLSGDIGKKIAFQLLIMGNPDLKPIHEDVLRSINRAIKTLIRSEEKGRLKEVISGVFQVLKDKWEVYPETVLSCIFSIGEGVYETDDRDFVNFFTDLVIDTGFVPAFEQGATESLFSESNRHHMKNVKTWMALISLKPGWSARFLSSLIINLRLSGVHIRDNDLFPREVTMLLSGEIRPVYNLVKQLGRVFPVFFNEIGAEGELRDVSTDLDEIHGRKDTLIHYLRKKCHVESSNRMVGFTRSVISYWMKEDLHEVSAYVPEDLLKAVSREAGGVSGRGKILRELSSKGLIAGGEILSTEEALARHVESACGACDRDRKSVLLLLKLHELLVWKYTSCNSHLKEYLVGSGPEKIPGYHKLMKALDEENLEDKISSLLGCLEHLKSVILAEGHFPAEEDIYHKRHFSVDIPSMYGSYHEVRFDAMGLTFRVESLLNPLLESYIEQADLRLITKATFSHIYRMLLIFRRVLTVDGISSPEFEKQMNLLCHALGVRGFTCSQYIDIFKGFASSVKGIINTYFSNIHRVNLENIIAGLPGEVILDKYKYREKDGGMVVSAQRVSEIFFREQLSLSPGLLQLDLFISRILKTLYAQMEDLEKNRLRRLLNYDPDQATLALDVCDEVDNQIIQLGNKGYNLMRVMDFKWKVPKGFVVTTEVFRYRDLLEGYRPAGDHFRKTLGMRIAELERKTGKRLGDPEKPLLLSVRSGSSISQPGMMDTFLNVGINEKIVEGLALASGKPWFAWDCFRRYLQCCGMALGLGRNGFDAIISRFKVDKGVRYKREFSWKTMREVARSYKKYILDAGKPFFEDPFEQVLSSIGSVVKSWDNPRAAVYRNIMGISYDWGTAVTVQEMVYGNLSSKSGSGVMFTHSPRLSGDTLMLWGDFTLGNQGEDVVAGLVETLPVSLAQKGIENRKSHVTLETDFPEIYGRLKEYAEDIIYERGWGPQEIEFTFEGASREDLYILQVRDMAVGDDLKRTCFVAGEMEGVDPIAHGIGVSGGAMCGRIVFSLGEIRKYRAEDESVPLILIRSDTVPDDIREINASDGLLTARGGMTSHASVVAFRLGKTCVVGCARLICHEEEQFCRIGNVSLRSGDYISMNGIDGSVFGVRIGITDGCVGGLENIRGRP